MQESIRSRAAMGCAVMVSSHLLSLVEDLCTSVLLMNRGKKLLQGWMADLRNEVTADGRSESLEDVFFRLTEAPEEPMASSVPEA